MYRILRFTIVLNISFYVFIIIGSLHHAIQSIRLCGSVRLSQAFFITKKQTKSYLGSDLIDNTFLNTRSDRYFREKRHWQL